MLFFSFTGNLFLLLVVSVLAIFITVKRKSLKKYNVYIILLIIIVFFIISYSYYRAQQINNMIKFGEAIRNSIEQYNADFGYLPMQIENLYPTYITKEQLDSCKKSVNYYIVSLETLNSEQKKRFNFKDFLK